MGGADCLCSSPSPSLGFGAGSQLDGSAARCVCSLNHALLCVGLELLVGGASKAEEQREGSFISWFKRRKDWRGVKIRRSTQVEKAEFTGISNPSRYYSTASSSVKALASHGTSPDVAGAN